MAKRFLIPPDRMLDWARGYGGCIASNMITVKGRLVGHCYREAPDFEHDSGWRFLAGVETQAYMDDAANLEIYDVNTIANHDPDIVAMLEAPVGACFVRRMLFGWPAGPLLRVADFFPPD